MPLNRPLQAIRQREQLVVIKRILKAPENEDDLEAIDNPVDNQVIDREQLCSVQPADPEALNLSDINHKLKYFSVVTREELIWEDYLVYKGDNYKLIRLKDWSDHGFYKAVYQEYKNTLPEDNQI